MPGINLFSFMKGLAFVVAFFVLATGAVWLLNFGGAQAVIDYRPDWVKQGGPEPPPPPGPAEACRRCPTYNDADPCCACCQNADGEACYFCGVDVERGQSDSSIFIINPPPAHTPIPRRSWFPGIARDGRCQYGKFQGWYERDLGRLKEPEQWDPPRPNSPRRAIRVLTTPFFSRGPILYKLEMASNGVTTLTTIWLAEAWLPLQGDAYRTMRHNDQHNIGQTKGGWRWESLDRVVRQRHLGRDEAWALWAIADEMNPASPYRKSKNECMEEGNWLVIEGYVGDSQIAPLRGFDRQLDRDRFRSHERGFDEDLVSERQMVRNNAETRFFCALVDASRTPRRVLARGDVADVCHNMIRRPSSNWDEQADDPYGPVRRPAQR